MLNILQRSLLTVGFFTLCLHSAYAQQSGNRVITGIVQNAEGQKLPGVNVTVKGTNTVAATDSQGKYTITIPSNAKSLVFSFVGSKAQEVTIADKNTINISLEPFSNTLDELVVIGYGSVRKANVTSSISSISEKDFKDQPVAGIDQALQGKVAGVTVTNNGGQPGGGVSVKVRGITSVNGTEPLYVIDGVPILTSTNSVSQDQLGGKGGQTEQSVLATLNPNDILSIDILKDASAQAIYGSLGANGVILVTTKKGKAGEGKFTYDGYYGIQQVAKKLNIMNLPQYATYYNSLIPEVFKASGTALNEIGELKDPTILGKGTDWQDALFQTGHTSNHQLAFSGGHNKTSYYFSLNSFDQKGTIIGSDFNRLASRFALDQEVKPWLKAGITANLSRSNQGITLTDGVETPTAIVLYNSPATPIKDANGNYITTSSLGNNTFGNANGNPIATALLREVNAIQNKAFGNIYAELKFTDYLTLRNEVNYDFQLAENTAFQPKIDNQNTGQSILSPSKLREDRNTSHFWALRNFLNFNKGFGAKHWVSAVLGHEAQESHYNGHYISAIDLDQNIKSINAGTVVPSGTNSTTSSWAMESYFGRASYTFDNKYAISGSLRRDGASSFGENRKHGTFTAISGAWTVTSEKFAKNWNAIDYLKFRVGYGTVGNQNSPVQNAYSTNIRLFPISPFGKGGIPANVGNPNLGWESVKTTNAGFDLTLLKKKLEITVDVYNKVTTDMILSTTLPVFAGLDPNPPYNAYKEIEPPVTNAGKMSNKGIDIGITSYNIQRDNFTWKTSVVFSHYKNKLVSLNSENALLRGVEQDFTGSTSVVNITRAGHAVGTFYGYVTDGLFRSMDELNNGTDWGLAVGPTGLYLGDVRYKDLNGDGKIGSEDVTTVGDPNPTFNYGITNNFTYKNFDVSIFLQGVQGSKIFNWTKKYTESLSNPFLNQSADVLNRYTESNPNASIPRFVNQWHSNNTKNSDRYIEDGSYLRIQNIAIGYNLPERWMKSVKASSARIYLSAQNLYTFTKYSGYDPEIGSFNKSVLSQNVDNGHYPNPRTFTIGANIQF